MKANEFMLGNFASVYPSNMPIKIAAVHNKKVAYHATTNRLTWVRMGLLRPIPLTTEILEKNGFYYGYTSNEEDLASSTIAQLSEEDKGWVWDEGDGSVKVIFPNESDGGEIQICDQSFDRSMSFVFAENIMLHELQNLLTICRIKKEIEL